MYLMYRNLQIVRETQIGHQNEVGIAPMARNVENGISILSELSFSQIDCFAIHVHSQWHLLKHFIQHDTQKADHRHVPLEADFLEQRLGQIVEPRLGCRIAATVEFTYSTDLWTIQNGRF